ncbi:sensor histidine kinase [Nocardia sp. CDC160]|uniref:sensor histidine kinase n=1 Tax=Nocardia sp. CDC160 TaxID=3112166 RepID=UPI002DBBDDE9|nr:histidine kinase [Nocardia sp. CDC160]MEC3913172.1 histidine kinase [Nocardia sp. CDC160]
MDAHDVVAKGRGRAGWPPRARRWLRTAREWVREVPVRAGAVPERVVDAVITVLVSVATVAPQLAAGRPWWVTGMALVAAVPLWWRRRAPVATGAVVGTAIIVLACAHALPVLPYGTVVCAYTIAAYSPPTARWAAVVVGVIGIAASLVLPQEPVEAYAYAALSFSTAWTLGTGVRARHAQIELLRERARRLDEEREAAVARERVRIARDVHDIVTHALGSMIIQAETGPLLTRTDPARADTVFAGIADTGRSAVRDLRHSLSVLRDGSPQPRHQPGIATIPDLVNGARRTGLNAELIETGTRRPVSSEIEMTAYRVVQQALANTLEHARAHRVEVTLDWSEAHLTVHIRDDGNSPRGDSDTAPSDWLPLHTGGFQPMSSPGAAGQNGSGLAGMRERVESCGGRLAVDRSESGFVVSAELPLAQEN